jgi:hypothetical protein
MAVIHTGDYGTVLVLTVQDNGAPVELQPESVLQLIFKAPNGVVFSRTATLYSDGRDGKITYTFQEGELDQDGQWRVQARIAFGGGRWTTTEEWLRVHPVLS